MAHHVQRHAGSGRAVVTLLLLMLLSSGCGTRSEPVAVGASSDEHSIVVAHWIGKGDTRLSVIDATDEEVRSWEIDGLIGRLAVSPEDEAVAFTSIEAEAERPSGRLYLLTATAAGPAVVDEGVWVDGLSWAPSGGRIAYGVVDRALARQLRIHRFGGDKLTTHAFPDRGLHGVWDGWINDDSIFVRFYDARRDGSTLQRLSVTDGVSTNIPGTADFGDAAPHPDGSRVAVTLLPRDTRDDDSASTSEEVFGLSLNVVDLGTGQVTPLAKHVVAPPVWSPGGNKLAALQRVDAALRLSTWETPTWEQTELATWSEAELDLSLVPFDWISDEALLIVVGDAGGPRLLEVAATDGAVLREFSVP